MERTTRWKITEKHYRPPEYSRRGQFIPVNTTEETRIASPPSGPHDSLYDRLHIGFWNKS